MLTAHHPGRSVGLCLLTPDQASRAVASFRGGDDRARGGGWMKNFLAAAT